jgi:hypothetical protein
MLINPFEEAFAATQAPKVAFKGDITFVANFEAAISWILARSYFGKNASLTLLVHRATLKSASRF